MRNSDNELHVAASYVAVTIIPPRFRSHYVRDISVLYSGEPITYILQALSYALTSVCFGLVANFLYDVATTSLRKKRRPSTRASLREYERSIEELRKYLDDLRKKKKSTATLKAMLTYHEQALLKIQEQDPEIQEHVADAIRQLESKGREKLAKKVDSHWK